MRLDSLVSDVDAATGKEPVILEPVFEMTKEVKVPRYCHVAVVVGSEPPTQGAPNIKAVEHRVRPVSEDEQVTPGQLHDEAAVHPVMLSDDFNDRRALLMSVLVSQMQAAVAPCNMRAAATTHSTRDAVVVIICNGSNSALPRRNVGLASKDCLESR